MVVVDGAQCCENFGEGDVAGAEAATVGFAEMDVAEGCAAIEDGLGERGFLDVHVDGVDHRTDSGEAHIGYELANFGDRIVEADLEMVDWFNDEFDAFGFGCVGCGAEAIVDAGCGYCGVWLVTAQALEEADDHDRFEAVRDIDVADEALDGLAADFGSRGAEAETVEVGFAGEEAGHDEVVIFEEALEGVEVEPEGFSHVEFDAVVAAVAESGEGVVGGRVHHDEAVFHVAGFILSSTRTVSTRQPARKKAAAMKARAVCIG